MAIALVEWTQRVGGRQPGQREIVELDTRFMQGCIEQGRVKVVKPVEDVVADLVEEPEAEIETPEETMTKTLTKPGPRIGESRRRRADAPKITGISFEELEARRANNEQGHGTT